MDHYDPAMVFSSIDEQGRYAYANQPRIALWNLTRLAECLLPLLSDEQDKAIEEAQSALGGFAEKFNTAYQAGLRSKLGLFTARDGDPALAQDLLDAAAKNQRRAARSRRSADRDAGGQSRLHSPESSNRSGHRSRRDPGRLCAIRRASDRCVKAVRRPAGVRQLCGGARTAPARASDVLRDVNR
jgi:hypothetical protein